MKKYFIYMLLSIAILVSIVTRLYKLGEAPAGFYVDEAGQGYSAYSLLKTGKDEFGKTLPIVFRSLTDFKTPVYVYLIVPLIPLFDLTPFTVRFPSFLFSILTIPILFYLIRELLEKSGPESSNMENFLPVISILLLSISPWHILFGRTNFECNVALFFFLSGVLFFYKSLKNPKLLILSAILFAIAIPAYHSQRIITPLTLTFLFFRYRKKLFSTTHKKYLTRGLIVGILILLPTLLISLTPGFLARASGLNIFSHARQMPDGFISNYLGILGPLINGSWFLSTREFFSLYFSYFSPRYMFILGDYGPRSSFPELSTFFMWQFPFYLWGLWVLFKSKKLKELKFFTILMLLISPIPASVTRDPYTTIRALPLVIPQLIVVSLGLVDIYLRIKSFRLKIVSVVIFIMLFVYSMFKLHSSVIILNEFYRARYWDWGIEEIVKEINNFDKEIPIVFDNARSDPELILAFFLKYDPVKYQIENPEVNEKEYYTNLTRVREKHVSQIVTRSINWENDLVIDQYLIGDELAISLDQIKEHKLSLIREIKFPDGKVAYRIVRTNADYERVQRETYLKEKNR